MSMGSKKFFLSFIIVFLISFSAGYLCLKSMTDSNLKSAQKEDKAVTASGVDSRELVTPDTVILKRIVYKSSGFSEEDAVKADSTMVGLGKDEAGKLLYKSGYSMLKFSPLKIEAVKEEDGYPPDSYILKGSGDSASVYRTDDKGKLIFLNKTDLMMKDLPAEDKEEIMKGKAFKTLDKLQELLDEYSS